MNRKSVYRRDLVVMLVLAGLSAFMVFGVGGSPTTAAQPAGSTPKKPPPPTESIDVELGVDFPYDI